jgi:hypothetical protein
MITTHSIFADTAFTPHAEFLRRRLEDDYKIILPQSLRDGLKTKERIEELAATCEFQSINVIHTQIRYPISIDEWWTLLNSAGFKMLIDQLSTQQSEELKERHLGELQEFSNGGNIELNVDSLHGVVKL